MLHTLKSKQLLHADIATVWSFMSTPKNLAVITPSSMKFEVISHEEELQHMYPGQIIEYYLKPVLGIKMHWVTEITHVAEQQFFVDEQRFGPYQFWHHKHSFKVVDHGVEMTDLLHYKIPFGVIGRIIDTMFVKKKIRAIFDYRHQKLEELFNKKIQSYNHK
jgi:ligand-binding SRPBCC domain-containing protein